MSTWLRRSLVATVVLVMLLVAAFVLDRAVMRWWPERVFAEYHRLQRQLEAGGSEAVVLELEPDSILMSKSGSVLLVYRPPLTAWFVRLQSDLYEHETHVIEIESACQQTHARVRMHHGSD